MSRHARPDDLAWTPERASRDEIVSAYHGVNAGTGTKRDSNGGGFAFIVIKFADVGHAAAWAASTDMTSRVTFPGGVHTLTAYVTVWLRTGDLPEHGDHPPGPIPVEVTLPVSRSGRPGPAREETLSRNA
jgi:hypothetical protein